MGASSVACATIEAQHTLTLSSLWHECILFGYILALLNICCEFLLFDILAQGELYRLEFWLYKVSKVLSSFQLERGKCQALACLSACTHVEMTQT